MTKKGRVSKIYSLSQDCIFSIKEIAAHCQCSESYALEMAMEKALAWYRKKWAREQYDNENREELDKLVQLARTKWAK